MIMVWLGLFLLLLVLVVLYDLRQTNHSLLRNFPIIGHFRYWLEKIGPELRQYIVTSNNEERPFSRDQRRWIYSSAKKENNYFGFGTDNDLEAAEDYPLFLHSSFPLDDLHPGMEGYDPAFPLACTKILGEAHGRRGAFRPQSVVNISAMSFGSLSAAAITALNLGVRQAGALHNTGEGGISSYHRQGGDLIWQIGTGYFGARASDGGFDLSRFRDTVASTPQLKAIEIKLSQGAKPGIGGILPGAKVTAEIAGIRGIPIGEDCVSPSHHTAFHDVDSLLAFVEQLAEVSGLPVGIKSAVGQQEFWLELARRMAATATGPDFLTIDGGEGGTGAGPLVFTDHVALPILHGLPRVLQPFEEQGLREQLVVIASGRLGLPPRGMLAFGLGADMINVAREAMLAIGCIQAQRCHTGHCPTGVATQSRWLQHGLDPTSKSERLANYLVTLRMELLRLSRACGETHPALVPLSQMEILCGASGPRPAAKVYHGHSMLEV